MAPQTSKTARCLLIALLCLSALMMALACVSAYTVRVATDKLVYTQGESVEIYVQILDGWVPVQVDFVGRVIPPSSYPGVYFDECDFSYNGTWYVGFSFTIPSYYPDGTYEIEVTEQQEYGVGTKEFYVNVEPPPSSQVVTVGPPGIGADFTSIGEAVSSPDVNDGATILVIPYTYYEGMIVVEKNLTITGYGGKPVVVGCFYARNVRSFYLSNIEVRGFSLGFIAALSNCSLYNVEVDRCTTGVLILDSTVEMSNCVVSSCSGEGIAIYGLGDVDIRDCSLKDNGASQTPSPNLLVVGDANVSLENVSISSGVWGVLCRDSENLTLSLVRMENCSSAGLVAENSHVEVSSCWFELNNWGLLLYGSSQVELEGCNIKDNNYDGAVCYDTSTLSISNSLIEGNGFTGLTLYDESQLQLSDSTLRDNQLGLLALHSSIATLSGCTVELNVWGIMELNESTISISSSSISSNVNEGVVALGSSSLMISSCSLTNNGFRAILMSDSSTATIAGSTIELNGVGNDGSAVWLTDNSKALISRSTIRSNNWGVVLQGNSYVTLLYCTMTQNDKEGLILYDYSHADISRSELTQNSFGVIGYGLSSASVNTTVVSCNTYDGVHLEGSSSFTGLYLNVTGNSWGFIVKDSAYLNVSYSNIFENTWLGVYTCSSLTAYATHCWWGGSEGPNGAGGDGAGNDPSSTLITEPYETTPIYW